MKFKLPVPIIVAAAALALISCGGSSGSGGGQISAVGRAVQNVQRLSIMSMSKSGIELAPFMLHGFGGGGGGGTTGGTGGGFGGVSPIGFFFRHFGDGSEPGGGTTGSSSTGGTSGTSGTTGSTTGTTTGTNGGDGAYFDEYLGLWVATEWSETSSTTTFSLDEAGTLPAGHVTSTFTADLGTYPQVFTNEYEFSAGPLAGSHGTYNCTQTTEVEGSMQYENTFADGSSDTGESHWDADDATWESRWEGPGGTPWFEDSGTWTAAGSGTYACTNSEGWSSTWTYNADWSGSATFTGPDPLLPATMTWTSQGHYHITYADGSTESWTWDDFWGDMGEGGTTGVGTSGSTGG
jgi:hypothetical protein